MAKTAVADIIIPTEFEKYAIERTAELANFGQCGIIEAAPQFDGIASGGGREVKMPFWKDLTATRQLLSDTAPLTVNKITADQDIARIHNDAQVWSVNHLVRGFENGGLFGQRQVVAHPGRGFPKRKSPQDMSRTPAMVSSARSREQSTSG